MQVGGVGFIVVVYQAASGCSSWDSKSLISCNDSGGRFFFFVVFGVRFVVGLVRWVVCGTGVVLIVAENK